MLSFVIFTKKRSFSLCKHPGEFPYTEIIDFNHVLAFIVKNKYFELSYMIYYWLAQNQRI